MRFSSTFSFAILPIIFAVIINCNTLISQAPLIVKSALTQSGSRAVSFEHTDANGILKITKVQQGLTQMLYHFQTVLIGKTRVIK